MEGKNMMIVFVFLTACFKNGYLRFFLGSFSAENSQNLVDWRTSNREQN